MKLKRMKRKTSTAKQLTTVFACFNATFTYVLLLLTTFHATGDPHRPQSDDSYGTGQTALQVCGNKQHSVYNTLLSVVANCDEDFQL